MPSIVSWPMERESVEQAISCLKNVSQKQLPMTAQEESVKLSKTSTDTDADILGVNYEAPNIDWVPSFENYMARVDRLSKSNARTTTLPPGFPERIEAPRTWAGHEFSEEKSYIYELSEAEVNEIEEALGYFKGLAFYTSRPHGLVAD